MASEGNSRGTIEMFVKARTALAALPVPRARFMWIAKQGYLELGGNEEAWNCQFGDAEAGLWEIR